MTKIIIFLFLFTYLIYSSSSIGESPYNYFSRLAESISHYKLYLTENPPWLNELIPSNGKYYVVYPPMPAILIVPFTLLFGKLIPQTSFSIILGSINCILVFILFKRMKYSDKMSALLALFFAFGTNHWYLSTVGSAWFLAHVVAIFFLLLSLIETFGKQRLVLIGLFLGASFWARTPVIFTTGFFYVYFWKKFWPLNIQNIKNFFLLNLGVILFIYLDGVYNYLRFGQITPFAPYNLIPHIDQDLIFKDGFMSFRFIPRHLEAILFKLPIFKNEFPYIIPSLYATAIWFTSPLVIYIVKYKKSLLTIACWVGIIPTFLTISMWAGIGYAQWGYRFIQDFILFILILIATATGLKQSKLFYLLLITSILINAWAIILINKLNIWSM